MKKIILFAAACNLLACHSASTKEAHAPTAATAHPAISTPDQSLAELKSGNQRFLAEKTINTNYKAQIASTKAEQHPHAVVLSCLDSRIPPEIIFDQGIGNIFVARNAGNIEDPNILGSMEFATKVKGVKLIVVMGHNHCGAVKGAIDNADLGHLTQLVDQIKPAIPTEMSDKSKLPNQTSENSVKRTMADILSRSTVINQLVNGPDKKVKIVGANYDIETGKVTFLP
jgi:carbonic anhydrase